MASAAPSSASARAMALPIPREDPVTTATFPARRAPSVASGPAALVSGLLLMRSSVVAPQQGRLRRAAQPGVYGYIVARDRIATIPSPSGLQGKGDAVSRD